VLVLQGEGEGTGAPCLDKHYLEDLTISRGLPLLDQGPTVPYYAASIASLLSGRKEKGEGTEIDLFRGVENIHHRLEPV
jgi:hypothetical protein